MTLRDGSSGMIAANGPSRAGGVDALLTRQILVVEDDPVTAQALVADLRDAGAKVTGPVSTPDEAMAALADANVDVALLDLNLGGQLAFALADRLRSRDIALIFVTGYDPFVIPQRFADVPVCRKPVLKSQLVALLVATLA